jgi:curved DNA-binding protein CbpA
MKNIPILKLEFFHFFHSGEIMVLTEELVDFYKILGITKNFTEEELKKSYRKLVLKYHPDVNKTSDGNEMFKLVLKAYTTLKDKKLRKAYDFDKFYNKISFKYAYKKFVEKKDEVFTKIKIVFKNVSEEKKIDLKDDIFDSINIPKEIFNMKNSELEERLLYSNNYYVRLISALALGYKKAEKSYASLEKRILDENLDVRKAVIWAIGNIGAKNSIPVLVKLYDSCESIIRIDILKAVYKISGESSVFRRMLVKSINDSLQDVRVAALEIVIKMNKKVNYETLNDVFVRIPERCRYRLSFQENY